MKPVEVAKTLYADGNAFFASVSQYLHPELRGRPVGIVPFAGTGAVSIIAASREAKRRGVKSVMRVRDAKAICPDIILYPSEPHLYRRAQQALLATMEIVVPVTAVKSIDEWVGLLDDRQATAPEDVAFLIKKKIYELFGSTVTVSIGIAANRLLAKIACDLEKPDGLVVLQPKDGPGRLLEVPICDVPGVGKGMLRRLNLAGIWSMEELLSADPTLVRKIAGGVQGSRLSYSLRGYPVEAGKTQKSMYGHGRVLPPDLRPPDKAREIGKMLMIKAGRKMRRDGFAAGRVLVELSQMYIKSAGQAWIAAANDEPALMAAFDRAWKQAASRITDYAYIMSLNVVFCELTRIESRQLDFLEDDEFDRRRHEKVTRAIDALNERYGTSIISYGPWSKGEKVGSSISFTSIPGPEAFY